MVNSASPDVREIALQRDEVPPSSVQKKALRGATLGSWGLAHLTGTWSGDGRPHLVGRELESIRLLHTRDVVLRERSPAVVTISAPAGMGKSRLIEEALTLARISAFEGRILSVAALPGDENNALMARLLRARFGLELGGERELILRRLPTATRRVYHEVAADWLSECTTAQQRSELRGNGCASASPRAVMQQERSSRCERDMATATDILKFDLKQLLASAVVKRSC